MAEPIIQAEPITEFELFQALRPFYPKLEYALLPQAANGTGAGSFRHCDALALSLWPSRGMHLSGFEIKTYRGDWLRELRQPDKAEEIAQFCNYWWIVTAGPFVKDGELPQPWGLMVWDEKKHALRRVKPAPFRKAKKPDLLFVAAALRKAQEVLTPDAALEEARQQGQHKATKEAESKCQYDLKAYRELKARIADFEAASGIPVTGWQDGKAIGELVRKVLNGQVEQDRRTLLALAMDIVTKLNKEGTRV